MGQTNDKTTKASQKPGQSQVKRERFNDATFIQYELDKATSQACKEWELTEDAAFHAMQGLVDAGYKVTIKYDSFSQAYGCFMSQGATDGQNAGFILTGRGSTPFKAYKQVLYKHFNVMGERWEAFDTARHASEIDD